MSLDTILGLVCAAVAAACFEVAYALQAFEARDQPPDTAGQLSVLGRLARRPRWLGGIALSVAGVALQLVALRFAPLTLVQPTLALGLLLLLAIGRRYLAEPVGRTEVLAALGIIAGVSVIAIVSPERESAHPSHAALLATMIPLGLAGVGPFAVRALGRVPGSAWLVLAAGAGNAFAALAAKRIADDAGEAWFALVLWAIAAGGSVVLALASEMSALQGWRATRVAPLVLVAQIVIPVALAPVVANEHPPLGWVVAGLVLVALGAHALSRSAWRVFEPEAVDHHVRSGGEVAPGEVG